MLRRPRFKPHFRVDAVPGEGVFLLGEDGQTVLQGRLHELVAPLVDGRPTAEICARLRGQVQPAQVYYALAQLEEKGYLSETDERLSPGEAAFYSLQNIDPAAAAARLEQNAVTLRVLGEVDPAPFRSLLQAMHVRLADEGGLGVVVTDSYLRPGLADINRQALRDGRPWLLVRTGGSQLWTGPLFRPGTTGCWACLAERLRANLPVAGYLEQRNGNDGSTVVDRCTTAASLQAGWALAANAVATFVVGNKGPVPGAAGAAPAYLDGKVQTLDLLTGQAQSHTLVRQPHCPACGAPGREVRATPVTLSSCKKSFTQDGGHRALTPQETLDRFGHHVSPITGAVTVLQRDGVNGDGVMHVYLSGHNVARRPKSYDRLRSDLRSSSCGKGTTELQAKASALCEGLERYSAVYRGDEPRRRARLAELGGDGLHPHDLLLFSERQYAGREAWNARQLAYDEIPLPFDDSAEVEWTPAWSLTRQAVRWLPTSFCYFNYPQSCRDAFCWSCSNGNAAGNTLEEAVLQGFLELVERDSVALWWYNRVRRPGVDLHSFGDPYVPALRSFLARHHRDLWVLDLTSDLGVPVFASLSRRTDGAAEQIMFGFGAHLDPRLALTRALTEMNQMLGQVLETPRDEPPGAGISAKETVEWLRTATVENQPYLAPLGGPARAAGDFPRCTTDDLRDDVLACQALVERQGMEMVVLDQTRPEIGLPVVKVVVPGLRHFWARFAPGRLYDVPVRLGWLDRPTPEAGLNPLPMFL